MTGRFLQQKRGILKFDINNRTSGKPCWVQIIFYLKKILLHKVSVNRHKFIFYVYVL